MLFENNNLIQINLGPQHPSTHGVLRIIGFVECETIKSVEPELGLLHRGSEKLIEYDYYKLTSEDYSYR